MLGFKDFCEEVKSQIPEYLMQYEIDNIKIVKVNKNNGQEVTGIAIMIAGESVAPNIYLDYYYSMYCHGTGFDSIMSSIRDEYNSSRVGIAQMDFKEDNIYDESRLFVKLVNYESNKDRLKDIPHERYLDMAVTVRSVFSVTDNGIASAEVNNAALDRTGMTAEELIAKAKENTPKLFPPVIENLKNIINIDMPGPDIYVLTNSMGTNGASCILYDDVLKNKSEELGCSFKVLPSSIHEVLLVPEYEHTDSLMLQEMVHSVNLTAVSLQDYLSDSVYEYDKDSNTLSIDIDGRESAAGLDRE